MIARVYPALLLLLVSWTSVAANAGDASGVQQAPAWVDPGWRRTVSRYSVTFDEQGLSTTVFDFEIQALDANLTEISAGYGAGVAAYQADNYKLAMARLKPYAERGSAKAQSYVGSMYVSGRGVEQDYGEAVRWFRMAAEQGDAYSQSQLGYLYEVRLGAARDEKLAAQWYAKAADQGDTYGQARLAAMYRDGRGLAQDFEQAAHWFSKAADRGSTWAQLNLGLLYIKGQGVPLDYTKAIFFLRNAADRNDSDAQYNLGWAYESGTGVSKDTQQAIEWYSKAADGGNSLARARWEGLTGGNFFFRSLLRDIGNLGRQYNHVWTAVLLFYANVIAELAEWLWRTV